MTQNQTRPSQRRRFFKRKARRILYGDWFAQVIAFMMFGGIYYGIVQFGESVSMLFVTLASNYYLSLLWYATFLVFALMFVIPLVTGMFNFEIKALERGSASLGDLFYAYENVDDLMRSYRIVFYSLLKVFAFFLPSLAVKYFLDIYYVPGIFGVRLAVFGSDAIYFVLCVLYIVLTAVGFVLSSKGILGIYVCVKRKDESLSDCFLFANICLRGHKKEMSALLLSFVPLCILSLFTVGFLFLMYTIPYILLTVTMYSGYLYDCEMYTKNAAGILYVNQEENQNKVVE